MPRVKRKEYNMKKTVLTAMTAALMLAAAACRAAPLEQKTPVSEPAQAEQAASPAETAPYILGDRIEDFTVTLSDGAQTSLYGLLSEKKAVFINLWASWCGPCRHEFPFMEQAYVEMSDEIGLIALSVEPSDTDETVLALKNELKLETLPMGLDTAGLAQAFNVKSYPTSVMVDRNGTVCFLQAGSLPDKDSFIRLFSAFTAPDYSQPVLLDSVPPVKPSVERPSAEALKSALGTDDSRIEIRLPEDECIWPVVPSGNGSYAQASNAGVVSSKAGLFLSVTADAGSALAYEYSALCPAVYDSLYAIVDGEEAKFYGGYEDWAGDCVKFSTGGAHTVEFYFSQSTDSSTECGLRNLRILTADELEALEAAAPAQPDRLPETKCTVEPLDGVFRYAKFTAEADGKSREIPVFQGEKLTLRFNVGEKISTDTAFVAINNTAVMLRDVKTDSKGYLFTPEAAQTDGYYTHTFQIYPSGFHIASENAVLSFSWLSSEAAADAYAEAVSQQYAASGEANAGVSWEYADSTGEKQESASAKYAVTVTDESGAPVSGVMIQVCSEETCLMETTGRDGTAVVEAKRYPYEIHILKTPEGCAPDTQIYVMPEEGGSIVIQLKKQS